jgi:hypothetical protein
MTRREGIGLQGEPSNLADDLLYGAEAIAEFLFGDEDERRKKNRRKVYGLVESGQLPVFRWGAILCARKSTIVRDIATRERATETSVNPAE